MGTDNIHIWPLLAGLGLFLFGMFMMEEALKVLAGRTFKRFLRKHTNNSVKAILSGATITALLQSSSMVALLVMSFAGAGIIGLKNGMGIIMGANLGTTATGWLVALIGFKLDIGRFILPFLAVGGLGIIFLKSARLSNLSKLLMGFSFMFLGLNYMKEGIVDFSSQVDVSFLQGQAGVLFILVGCVLSASIQSSSAAMMIFLSSLAAGMIGVEQAFYLVAGADLGTTMTALIGTINGNSMRKKVGYFQVAFNLLSVALVLLLMPLYVLLVLDWLAISDKMVALVTFHSLFNLFGILLLLPFLKPLSRFIDRRFGTAATQLSRHLSLANPHEPHSATESLEKECQAFLTQAISVNNVMVNSSTEKTAQANKAYFQLKAYEAEIIAFYLQLQEQDLAKEEVKRINGAVASIRNATLSAKDVKDIKHNLNELRNAVTDQFYQFYQTLLEHQANFYKELNTLFNNKALVTVADIENLSDMQTHFFQNEVKALQVLYHSTDKQEIDFPSLLNVVWELGHSNESLLRAVNYLFFPLVDRAEVA